MLWRSQPNTEHNIVQYYYCCKLFCCFCSVIRVVPLVFSVYGTVPKIWGYITAQMGNDKLQLNWLVINTGLTFASTAVLEISTITIHSDHWAFQPFSVKLYTNQTAQMASPEQKL